MVDSNHLDYLCDLSLGQVRALEHPQCAPGICYLKKVDIESCWVPWVYTGHLTRWGIQPIHGACHGKGPPAHQAGSWSHHAIAPMPMCCPLCLVNAILRGQ